MTTQCPCGATRKHTCNACGRALCEWHAAGRPFPDMEGGVELGAVCLPACDAPWWLTLAVEARP